MSALVDSELDSDFEKPNLHKHPHHHKSNSQQHPNDLTEDDIATLMREDDLLQPLPLIPRRGTYQEGTDIPRYVSRIINL